MNEPIEPSAQENDYPGEKRFSVCLFRNKFDIWPKPVELTLAELVALLTTPKIRSNKDGQLICPAVFKGGRKNENVISLSLLILDYDHKASLEVDLKIWIDIGILFIVYTSHSHRRVTKENPNAEERFRVVIPLAKPIPASIYAALWKWAATQTSGKIDSVAKDLSRMYGIGE
ncbi:MAG: hypothetical protein AB1489_40530 [Acidobacteriota bacterium]